MAIFNRILIKSFAIFFSITLIIMFTFVLLSFFERNNSQDYTFISGDKNSSNIIAIIELNGLIIESYNDLRNLANPFVISPREVENDLKKIATISPKVIIFSINSPGGTVSASKNLYDIIKNFKKNNDIEIIFHTKELLASGGYWVSTSADKIYASYGSIIGSIGVKGPDWFFYDKPQSISTGIFGNRIETKNSIKIFSSSAGKSKDIFNPFREPSDYEIKHLQKMVNIIYNDFVRVVSKERKIEIENITNEIGALIYTAKEANLLHLIDDELNLNEVIDNIIDYKNFDNYKVLKKFNQKNSILKEIFFAKILNVSYEKNYECISMRSSISAILSYQSTGC